MRLRNQKNKLRVLEPGDKVLVLLPTVANKLLFQWKGVAEVVERRGVVNYRIRFATGQEKTFHINMLKRYIERDNDSEQSGKIKSKSQVEEEVSEQDVEINESVAAVIGVVEESEDEEEYEACLLYTSPSPRDGLLSRMPSSA